MEFLQNRDLLETQFSQMVSIRDLGLQMETLLVTLCTLKGFKIVPWGKVCSGGKYTPVGVQPIDGNY